MFTLNPRDRLALAFSAALTITMLKGEVLLAQRVLSLPNEVAPGIGRNDDGTLGDESTLEEIAPPYAWCEPPSHFNDGAPHGGDASANQIELPPKFHYAVQRNYGALPNPYHPVGYTYARPWGGWGFPPYGFWGIYGYRGLYPRPWGYWRYSYPTYYGFYRPWYPYAPYSPYAFYYRYPRLYTAPWYAYYGPGVYEYSPPRAYYDDSYAGCYYW